VRLAQVYEIEGLALVHRYEGTKSVGVFRGETAGLHAPLPPSTEAAGKIHTGFAAESENVLHRD
jgi:hypothetical protein